MIYITSDQHFFSGDIIRFALRSFKSVVEMNNTIIERWNNIVKEDDIIYNLGDVSSGTKEETRKVIQSLNGRKILIKGNHDRDRNYQWWKDVGFADVIDGGVLLRNEKDWYYKGSTECFYMLTHEPNYLNSRMPYVNIHGHTHLINLAYPGYYNVSVDVTDYTPVAFDQIIEDVRVRE